MSQKRQFNLNEVVVVVSHQEKYLKVGCVTEITETVDDVFYKVKSQNREFRFPGLEGFSLCNIKQGHIFLDDFFREKQQEVQKERNS